MGLHILRHRGMLLALLNKKIHISHGLVRNIFKLYSVKLSRLTLEKYFSQ